MPQRTVAVIGSTGLIGSHLKQRLAPDDAYDEVRLIVRRPADASPPKVVMKLVSFEDYESLKLAIDGCDAVFSAIGTTQKNVKGDKAAYRKIDYGIAVNAARACSETGVRHFSLVSSVGANSRASSFYLKLKGEIEEAVQTFPIPSVAVFRPSMLLGDRKESRPGEGIGQRAFKIFSPLLVGDWKKFKPIEAEDVAAAMIAASKAQQPGVKIYHYAEMMTLLKR